jgi:hypothetical protein
MNPSDEERMARFELQTAILENNSQMLNDAIKPWKDFADVMKKAQDEDSIERTADCAQRYLYELCHRHAFKEVREILRHTHEYMQETIEVLEERENEENELPLHPAQFHRSSP